MPDKTRSNSRDTGGAELYSETAWLQRLKRLHVGCNPLRFRSVAELRGSQLLEEKRGQETEAQIAAASAAFLLS